MPELVSNHTGISLAYTKYGTGHTAILGFHGFGHPKEDWNFISPYLDETYCFIAIDVPGHGQSEVSGDRLTNHPIQKKEWKALIELLLEKENIQEFHVMGYSLGGRIALVTAEVLTPRILSITLFSPDGLHKSLMFKFANEWSVGRKLFQFIIRKVQWCIPVVKLFQRLGFISQVKRKFVLYQLENEDRLTKVKIVWASLSLLWPNFDALFLENHYSKNMLVIFGEKDPIILPQYGKSLAPYSYPLLKIMNVPFGHRTSKKEVLDFLKGTENWPFKSLS